jgi:hypothetical protein
VFCLLRHPRYLLPSWSRPIRFSVAEFWRPLRIYMSIGLYSYDPQNCQHSSLVLLRSRFFTKIKEKKEQVGLRSLCCVLRESDQGDRVPTRETTRVRNEIERCHWSSSSLRLRSYNKMNSPRTMSEDALGLFMIPHPALPKMPVYTCFHLK